jgi:hypothetical protein
VPLFGVSGIRSGILLYLHLNLFIQRPVINRVISVFASQQPKNACGIALLFMHNCGLEIGALTA